MRKKMTLRIRALNLFFGICAMLFAALSFYWMLQDFQDSKLDGVIVFFMLGAWSIDNSHKSCEFALFAKHDEA